MRVWIEIGCVVGVCGVAFLHATCGYANVIDRVGLFLHRHAVAHRHRHAVVANTLSNQWDLEATKSIRPVSRERLG